MVLGVGLRSQHGVAVLTHRMFRQSCWGDFMCVAFDIHRLMKNRGLEFERVQGGACMGWLGGKKGKREMR